MHDLFLGRAGVHRQGDPAAAPAHARCRGIDGAHPVLERAVQAGVALDVDRRGVGRLGVRKFDADEDALSVRLEPDA